MVVEEEAPVTEYLAIVLFDLCLCFVVPHEVEGATEVDAHEVTQGFLWAFFEHDHADFEPVCHIQVIGKLAGDGGFADAAARCEQEHFAFPYALCTPREVVCPWELVTL